MSIWFHEGLPRSGKSYEAVVKHMLPAIVAGRQVVTNIKGINCEKIAEVTEVPIQDVESLVTLVPWDDSKDIWKYAKTDGMILFDEVQDFFPATRDRLGVEITELITQHGHRGIDVILMGQAMADVHALWRRRVDKKIYFVQKDAIGQPHKYSWTLYKQTAPDKFAKINSGGGEYEKKYFGTYSSHTDDTSNKDAYKDDRANLFKRPLFRYGFPAFGLVLVFAIWNLYSFFTSAQPVKKQDSEIVTSQPAPPLVPVAAPIAQAPVVVEPIALEEYTPPADYFEQLSKDLRPRLSAFVQFGNKIYGQVDFFKGDGLHRDESLTFAQIESLGWSVSISNGAAIFTKGEGRVMVTAWPIDLYGVVPARSYDALGGKPENQEM